MIYARYNQSTFSFDGSEDHLIYCFKDEQTCSTGAERLKVLASTIEDDREDLSVYLKIQMWRKLHLVVVDSDDETDDLLDI